MRAPCSAAWATTLGVARSRILPARRGKGRGPPGHARAAAPSWNPRRSKTVPVAAPAGRPPRCRRRVRCRTPGALLARPVPLAPRYKSSGPERGSRAAHQSPAGAGTAGKLNGPGTTEEPQPALQQPAWAKAARQGPPVPPPHTQGQLWLQLPPRPAPAPRARPEHAWPRPQLQHQPRPQPRSWTRRGCGVPRLHALKLHGRMPRPR
mmetsp:Transcript_98896/g.308655  ORF Transcript_98896/g.308655 Transcript_98896/m.308655 type:complete len:207 (+) Transcript_98896:393-1013(+)